MNFYENALAQKYLLEKRISQLEKRIPTYPEGRLRFQKSKGRLYPYQELGQKREGSRKRKYLNSGSQNVAELLARKYCDELCLIDYRRELAAVNAYLRECGGGEKELDKIFDSWELFEPYLKKKDNATLTPEEQAFLNEPWIQSKDHPEHLNVKVRDGLTVRSKSESCIAIAMDRRKLNYRYECINIVCGFNIASDFTAFNRRQNRPMIWEHFGRMDDIKYRDDTCWKIDKYLRDGYTPNKDIIFTFETNDKPFTIEKAENILREFFD